MIFIERDRKMHARARAYTRIHSIDIEKGIRARFQKEDKTRSFDHSILSVQGDLGPFVQKTKKRGLSPTDNQVESCTVGIIFKE